MNDKDFEIKDIFENTPIPKKLLPENIAKMLKEEALKKPENEASPTFKEQEEEDTKSLPTLKFKGRTRMLASLAACALIVIGIAAVVRSDSKLFEITKSKTYDFKTELSAAKDYSEVYKAIQKINITSHEYFLVDGLLDGAAPTTPSNDKGSNGAKDAGVTSKASSDYSQTHQQAEGVDEADVIKTDGKNIYYISNGNFYIVDTNSGNMKIISKMVRENVYAEEMYIVGNTAVLISDVYENNKNQNEASSSGASSGSSAGATTEKIAPDMVYPGYYGTRNVMVEIIDISNPASPVVSNTYKQNGYYISSRLIDNNLYLVTNFGILTNYNSQPIKNEKDIDQFVPTYSVNDKKCYINPEDINIPENAESSAYTIVAGLDITQAEPLVSIKALLGYNGTMYSSKDSLYIVGQKWETNQQASTIAKFSLDKGKLTHTAFATLNGAVLNQFSMDEFEGNFRIATTTTNYSTSERSSGVYVLDKDLKIIGKVTGLAKTETIKSVRFEGKIAYVVTFKQTDPLFAIDLSNPSSPRVESELKINGYSSYLIKYGDGKLFGFGADADDKGKQTGLKVSMFKTDDSKNVSEITSLKLGDDLQGAYSPGLYNHKSLLINAEKNIIGIPVSFFDGIDQCNRYYLISYSEANGFKIIGKLETHDAAGIYSFSSGMYIGDVVYAFSGGRIISAKVSDMSVISTLEVVDPKTVNDIYSQYKKGLID